MSDGAADAEWHALWEIHRSLGGPKPPQNVLVRHQDTSVYTGLREAAEMLRAKRTSDMARVTSRLLIAALAVHRFDVADALRRRLRSLRLANERGKRAGPRIRVWRAA